LDGAGCKWLTAGAAGQMACSKSGHLMELRRRKTFETNNEKKIRKDKESARNRRLARRKQRESMF
jgi:ribosomal protein S21